MQTLRQEIMRLLQDSELSTRDLSRLLGIREKEVILHLPHVAKSINAQGKRLQIFASTCRQCGYVFKDRRRFTRPGRCPRCKSTYIDAPYFKVV
jgi:predicted Zn-ribbon and HTH transcriptional regulator